MLRACSAQPCVATTVSYTTQRRKCCLPPVPPLSPATVNMTFRLWKPLPHLPLPLPLFVIRDSLKPHDATTLSLPVQHSGFKTAQLTLTYNKQITNLFCIYRPPPSKKNKFSDSMFFDQFSDFLEY